MQTTRTKNRPPKHREIIRYAGSTAPKTRPTYTADDFVSSLDRTIFVPAGQSQPSRYQRGGDVVIDQQGLTAGALTQIVDALEQTAWVQWVKGQMAKEQGDSMGGDEAGLNAPAPAMDAMPPGSPPAERKPVRPAKAPRDERMEYSRSATSSRERYERRQRHVAAQTEHYAKYNASRQQIAERAAEYAMVHNCSYEQAVHRIGEELPSMGFAPAV